MRATSLTRCSVKKIRIRNATGAFRKTQKTGKTDLDLAAKRYRDLLKEIGP